MKGMTILIAAWIVAPALSGPSITPFAHSNALVADPTGQEEPGPGQGTKGGRKEARWSGMIVRSDKDAFTLTVRRRGSNIEKIVHYDSSTKWTTPEGKEVKAIESNEVKDGDRVIALGSYDEKGEFHATRISLRKPK